MAQDERLRQGFLGDTPDDALLPLLKTLNDHVVPFLREWWDPENPVPSDDQVRALLSSIGQREGANPPTIAYQAIPELLRRLAGALRFNRRNYVNVHPSPFVPAALASFIVSLQNPNNIVEFVSKATWKMEEESIAWLAQHLFGLPSETSWGNVVSGGTVANMTALLVARDYTYDKLQRPRPSRVGPRGGGSVRSGVVLGTAATHYSVEKALWFLGMGSEGLVRVPVCHDERMFLPSFNEQRFVAGIRQSGWRDEIADAISEDRKRGREQLDRFYANEQSPFDLQPLGSEILKTLYSCFQFDVPLVAAVLTLGTTDTGTIERVDTGAIRRLREEDVPIHVDAASGGFAFLDARVRAQMNDLSSVDSFTADPHKLGFLHYPCGAVIFRSQGAREQIYHEAPYLGPLAPTLEGSRPGSHCAGLWVALNTLGVEGYKTAVGRLLDFAQEVARELGAEGSYQVLHRVDLNALAIAPIPAAGETRREVNALVRNIRDQFEVPGAPFLVNYDKHLSAVKVSNLHRSPSKLKSGASVDPVDIEALRLVFANPLVEMRDAKLLVESLAAALRRARGG